MMHYDTTIEQRGLYDGRYEHDACGVGFVCNLRGEKSHGVVSKALEILVNLTHRGACGCDARTGDGAGILMQIPDAFLRDRCADERIDLPEFGDYGVGMVFLPVDPAQQQYCIQRMERTIRQEGQHLLGWRDMPVDTSAIGDLARQSSPVIKQVFIGRSKEIKDERAFERKLYVIRKVMQHAIRESDIPDKRYFHIATLSCRTICYKGLLLADQITTFYPDLEDDSLVSGMALVHQRYSTNTFPTWGLAQPFRFLCHNGEINTLRGNINWMNARQALFKSEMFGDDMPKLAPVLIPGASDSAILDNAIELLYHTGRSLPHAIMMLIPEAWQNHETMSQERKAFYEFHSSLIEPWDGPASIPFTDGTCIGAVLDRNGLRPSRYLVTKDGFVVMASETGVLDIDPANIDHKGRLQPGRMFLVDTDKGRIVEDEEVKAELCDRQPYRWWLNRSMVRLDALPEPINPQLPDPDTLVQRQNAFGYTLEDMKVILGPMASDGKEPTGSMGNDTPLAVLSNQPQLLYNYFKQLFAQVTNPPLDAIREELVTSLVTSIGASQDIFEETQMHCHKVRLNSPFLTNEQLARLKEIHEGQIRSIVLPMRYRVNHGGKGLARAMDELCFAASRAVAGGYAILILSDRDIDEEYAPIPALLAASGVHHHLIRTGQRTPCSLVIESGEPREIHHYCTLFGYSVGAINPYVALESVERMAREGMIEGLNVDEAIRNYIKAAEKGVLKVMSKMGISTLHSYRGAQIFEAIGISTEVIDKYFSGTASRLEGIGLNEIAEETRMRHQRGFARKHIVGNLAIEPGGQYSWRRNGEHHLFNPHSIATLQEAGRTKNADRYAEYAKLINDQTRKLGTLRGMLSFIKRDKPIPIGEVEPWTEIVKRFKTGAMSFGSLSKEAHENLAIAMNRIGGKSNSGEGGEDPDRYDPDDDQTWRNSAIKQVASGRFGVTSNYLAHARELQIKMAQGAKPGEGGQLPAHKVLPWIAKTRFSTPYVQLISPPPHHDIYSIEDLAQLIHDLKNANPDARINVKLVAEVGVGTVAAGVSKGKADVILISGHDGGTGASPQTSIKHAGLPWELGLAETHQTLVINDLRSRVRLECDGQLKTGRDVAIACLLGAEEFGFATAPLVVSGCIMMRKCHLNTCPVGVATQDPELRKKFTGKPEHVINFFYFVAEELRQIMAELGFRTINEMVGRADFLQRRTDIDHWKAKLLDLSRILYKPEVPDTVGTYCSRRQDHGLAEAIDHHLIAHAKDALDNGTAVEFDHHIKNTNRTVGTMLSHEISKRYGEDGLPEDTIRINCTGSAGQSFCAFGATGLTMRVEGDANDYFGKGLSGAKMIIYPPHQSTFVPEENIIIGNVALYGATRGQMYVRGKAGERFAVRNSGAHAVVEGVGDHGCEYMTGGRVVVLGPTGRNFAAGMSGGFAYVYDVDGDFAHFRCNTEMVDLEPVNSDADAAELRSLIERHHDYTGSTVARGILDDWEHTLLRFVKVSPRDYKKALQRMALEEAQRVNEEATAIGR